MDFTDKDVYTMEDLLAIITMLRSENGCPWDRAQTHHSIRNNFIEETYEAVEALDTDNTSLLREELGDVLMQILLHSEMEREVGGFSFDDVVDDLGQKLVFRHPHVFGNVKAANESEALDSWNAAKAVEKHQENGTDRLKGVTKSLPALMRAQKVIGRAEKVGFTRADDPMQTLVAAVGALGQAEGEQAMQAIGDVLLAVTEVARQKHIESEQALSESCDRFVSRFEAMENALDKPIDAYTPCVLREKF